MFLCLPQKCFLWGRLHAWSIFNPGVELSPVDPVDISALPVTQNYIKIKRAITWQSFQPRAEFNPGLKFQPASARMSYWSMRGSDYLLQETNWSIKQ